MEIELELTFMMSKNDLKRLSRFFYLRTHPQFLAHIYFHQEVPEIFEGVIIVVKECR